MPTSPSTLWLRKERAVDTLQACNAAYMPVPDMQECEPYEDRSRDWDWEEIEWEPEPPPRKCYLQLYHYEGNTTWGSTLQTIADWVIVTDNTIYSILENYITKRSHYTSLVPFTSYLFRHILPGGCEVAQVGSLNTHQTFIPSFKWRRKKKKREKIFKIRTVGMANVTTWINTYSVTSRSLNWFQN